MRIALCFIALWLVAAVAVADIEVGYEGGEQGKVVVNVEETLAYQLQVWATAETGTQSSNYRVGLYYPVGDQVFLGIRYNTFEDQATGFQWGLYYRSRSLLSIPVKETPKWWQEAWTAYNQLDPESKAEVDAVMEAMAKDLNEYLESLEDEEGSTEDED